mmetsp:Transcript_2139/g.6439  ORF Transcript_2139/g.6439 Transcript_2139/m.6439 type:complete len:354 (+) Transcript_2139:798-1859(+)
MPRTTGAPSRSQLQATTARCGLPRSQRRIPTRQCPPMRRVGSGTTTTAAGPVVSRVPGATHSSTRAKGGSAVILESPSASAWARSLSTPRAPRPRRLGSNWAHKDPPRAPQRWEEPRRLSLRRPSRAGTWALRLRLRRACAPSAPTPSRASTSSATSRTPPPSQPRAPRLPGRPRRHSRRRKGPLATHACLARARLPGIEMQQGSARRRHPHPLRRRLASAPTPQSAGLNTTLLTTGAPCPRQRAECPASTGSSTTRQRWLGTRTRRALATTAGAGGRTASRVRGATRLQTHTATARRGTAATLGSPMCCTFAGTLALDRHASRPMRRVGPARSGSRLRGIVVRVDTPRAPWA